MRQQGRFGTVLAIPRTVGSSALAVALMDDAEFLQELDHLDIRPKPAAPRPVAVERQAPVPVDTSKIANEIDMMAAIDAIDESVFAEPKADRRGHIPRFILPDVDVPDRAVDDSAPRIAHPVLAVVGFALMMSLGAGAAALVFHDRVTQIVAQFNAGR